MGVCQNSGPNKIAVCTFDIPLKGEERVTLQKTNTSDGGPEVLAVDNNPNVVTAARDFFGFKGPSLSMAKWDEATGPFLPKC